MQSAPTPPARRPAGSIWLRRLLIVFSPIPIAWLVFAVVLGDPIFGILAGHLFLVFVPPFLTIALVDTSFARPSLRRVAGMTILPGVVLVIGCARLAAAPSSTSAIGFGVLATALVLVALIEFVILAIVEASGGKPPRPGHCPNCGYSRFGLPTDAPCPECGKEVKA